MSDSPVARERPAHRAETDRSRRPARTEPRADAPGDGGPRDAGASSSLLHRRALLAGLVTGPALVWGAGAAAAATSTSSPTATATPTATDSTAGDASTATPTPTSTATTPSTSPNGWTVGNPAASIGVKSLAVAGTSIVLPVSATAAGTVLTYVARRFHTEVEALHADCWGYAYRANVNNTSVWSNHASGTAIDLNSSLHPNGKVGTFTSSQQSAIRAMLADLQGVVRWGGNYSSTKDEMHFEINVKPSSQTLLAVATAITSGALDTDTTTAETTTTDDDPENPVRNLTIGKSSKGAAIWVGDGLGRRQIADMNELVALQYWIRLKGGDPTVYTIDDLRVLGAPM